MPTNLDTFSTEPLLALTQRINASPLSISITASPKICPTTRTMPKTHRGHHRNLWTKSNKIITKTTTRSKSWKGSWKDMKRSKVQMIAAWRPETSVTISASYSLNRYLTSTVMKSFHDEPHLWHYVRGPDFNDNFQQHFNGSQVHSEEGRQ